MANRRIEMYEYRQIIFRLRQNQTNRAISRDGMGCRDKISEIKRIAKEQGWLDANASLPEDETLHAFFAKKPMHVQKLKIAPYVEIITQWVQEGIQAKIIFHHLQKKFGFDGEYSCVQRFVKRIKGNESELTVPLDFKPGEAAQVDFGQGPVLLDERTGKEEKTWFFLFTLCWSRHQYAEFVKI